MKKLLLPILVLLFILGRVFFAKLDIHAAPRVPLVPTITPVSPLVSPSPSVGLPVRIAIPKIGVDAAVEDVGLDAQKRMDVPLHAMDVGWYDLGYRPGEKGSAVIDGHLDTVTGAPAVFWNLKKLENGDTIIITDAGNKTYTFTVTNVIAYPFDQVPLEKVFGPSTKVDLNLITCEGTWDQQTHNYSQRTVVYTTLTKS